MRFEIDKNVWGQYIWRLRASNGRIIANGESYPQKHNCQRAIDLVKGARLEQFFVYPDSAREWRWHLKALNGEIIAQSSEGYVNRIDCENAARLVYQTHALTPVYDLTVEVARHR